MKGRGPRRRCERRAEVLGQRGDTPVMAGMMVSYLWKCLDGAAHTACGHARPPAYRDTGDKEIMAKVARAIDCYCP